MPAKIYYASAEILSLQQAEIVAQVVGVVGFMPVFGDSLTGSEYSDENDTTLVSFMAEEPEEPEEEEDEE